MQLQQLCLHPLFLHLQLQLLLPRLLVAPSLGLLPRLLGLTALLFQRSLFLGPQLSSLHVNSKQPFAMAEGMVQLQLTLQTVELVDLIEMRKTDCFGETNLSRTYLA